MQASAGSEPVLCSDLTFVRKMNGCSQSLLVRDGTDQLWIVKLKDPLCGANTLANEMLGSALCRAVGLPVPEVKAVKISRTFFTDERTWLYGSRSLRRPQAGLHLATRFVPDCVQREAVEFLPYTLRSKLRNRSDCLGIFIFDRWAMNADSRQALFFEEKGNVGMTFIDHGHLFGGPDQWSEGYYHGGGGRMLEQFAVEEWDRGNAFSVWVEKLQQVLPDAFDAAAAQIPLAWYSGDISALRSTLLNRLRKLDVIAAVALEKTRARNQAFAGVDRIRAKYRIRVLCPQGSDAWLTDCDPREEEQIRGEAATLGQMLSSLLDRWHVEVEPTSRQMLAM